MSDDKKTVEDRKYTIQDFAKAYNELCEKMGYRIVVNPAYIARDDSSFSTVLQYSIGRLPEKNLTTN